MDVHEPSSTASSLPESLLHRIISCMLMMFIGSAILGGYVGSLVSVGLLFICFWNKLRLEEALMLKHFPNEYPAYMQSVKRLIPFIF